MYHESRHVSNSRLLGKDTAPSGTIGRQPWYVVQSARTIADSMTGAAATGSVQGVNPPNTNRGAQHMTIRAKTPAETYGPALTRARQQFAECDPVFVAARASVSLQRLGSGERHFSVPFFGTEYHLLWPTGDAQQVVDHGQADITTHILLLHYLLTADGTAMASNWIAFRSLPGGLGYDAAFQRHANLRLGQRFGSDGPAFGAAARVLAGERLAFGDVSFSFRALPCLWLAVVLHLADEEFPASANVLFDGAASHYLLSSHLIRAARTP